MIEKGFGKGFALLIALQTQMTSLCDEDFERDLQRLVT